MTTFRLEGGPFDEQLVEGKAGAWKIWLTTLEPMKGRSLTRSMIIATEIGGEITSDFVSDCFRWVLYLRAGKLDSQGIPIFFKANSDPDAAVGNERVGHGNNFNRDN